MGIQICREEQGKGYGSEAIKWVLEWGFLAAGLHRVTIGCFSFNEGARRLYERLGFVVEGGQYFGTSKIPTSAPMMAAMKHRPVSYGFMLYAAE